MKVRKERARGRKGGTTRTDSTPTTVVVARVDETARRSVLNLVDELSRGQEGPVTVTSLAPVVSGQVNEPVAGDKTTRPVTRNQAAPAPRTAQRLNRLKALRLVNRFCAFH